jgi:glycosyltransferase involved in cell wall biosynthesis
VIQLLTVGRLEPEKNPSLLVRAIAQLERDRPGRYRLDWVGRGPLEERVFELASELGIEERIEFRGYVPFDQGLLDLYRRAHVFVHVSLSEGMPQVVIEALASGTPIVATDVGGVRAAVENGRAALLVPPDDLGALVAGLLRVSDDPALRERLTARGLALARGMTLEVEAARVVRFIGSHTTSVRD